jgi:spermidine synthase
LIQAFRIAPRYHAGIFVLSLSILAFQIIITRFFSVVLYYHFAFAAISLAMLGLTRGALEVFNKPARYRVERVAAEFARHATWFALSSVVAMVVFLSAPVVAHGVQGVTLFIVVALTAVGFVVPFTEGGVCVTLLLTRLPYAGGWLYAADLSGAALGCLGVILLLMIIDPASATLWLASAVAGAGWLVVRGDPDRSTRRLSGAVAVALGLIAIVHTGLYVSGKGHLGVVWAKGVEQTNTLFERWNTYSRIRVTPMGESRPFGWGMAHEPTTTIDQDYLDIDADAGTVITRYDGNIGKLAYLRDDVINSAYLVKAPEHVAVVGVGGGRDVLSALYFGAKRITGIELNPAIFEVLTDKFADFSGHLDREPGVSLVNAEARSYINHSPDRYDLIQISLIDTWAATAAGGLTLTENRLYTVQAWEDFYRALEPGGMLSVSRWYSATQHTGEFYRLIAIAAAALEARGVAPRELARHVIAVTSGGVVTVISRPDAFTDAEWQEARSRLAAEGFHIMLGPDIAFDATTSTILSDRADMAFFASLPQDVTPSTDDRPFFFYTARLSDIGRSVAGGSMHDDPAITITLLLVAMSLGACVYYVVVPFLRLRKTLSMATLGPPVAYFSAIGIGFMLIEISQMQRLMVFLGHPVYGLGVVLFTLLLFSGIGSATVGAAPARGDMVIARIAAVVVVVALAGLLTPVATSWGRTQTTDMRIVISVLLLAPPAFCMGMMFPLGLSIWRRHADLTSFFWAANGIMSMTASVFGMALSIELGIARTYAIGAMFYVICGLALFSGWLLNRQGLGARAVGKAKPRLSPRTLGARAGVSSGEPA